MFINRDYSRTEHDDFVLNIEPKLQNNKEAVPIYEDTGTIPQILGWKIQLRYE